MYLNLVWSVLHPQRGLNALYLSTARSFFIGVSSIEQRQRSQIAYFLFFARWAHLGIVLGCCMSSKKFENGNSRLPRLLGESQSMRL